MENKLNVSSNPHIRSKVTTNGIMMAVVLALLPATGYGIYHFGIRALYHVLITVATCIFTEFLFGLYKKKMTITDLSCVVTGLLLALNLPVNAPLWIGVMGGVFAILIVKCLFGGLGQNFMNPALGARCFLLISFPALMTNFTYDGISSATPLAALKSGESVDTLNMFFGNIGGTIGETSTLAILIGAAFLLLLGIIDLKVPASYLITFSVFVVAFGGNGFDVNYLAAQLCGGGIMLGAFFMATDYVTRPITFRGQIVFGIILGLLTGIFRIFGPSAEGVSYAIIIGNLLTPLIEKVTMPVAFGKGGMKNGK